MSRVVSPARIRVLGVDPGSHKTGWGVVDVSDGGRSIAHVDNGVVFLDGDAPLAVRLLDLSRRIVEVASEHAAEVGVVEDVFVHKGARSALILGQARGAVLAALGMAGLPVQGYPTARVKALVTGRGAATKVQVQEMVRALLRLPEVPFEDAADALAVAICHAHHTGVPAAMQSVSRSRRGGAPSSSAKGRAGLLALARAQGKA